jgi:hypothetical protein
MLKSPQAGQAVLFSPPGSAAFGWDYSPVSGAIEFELRRMIHPARFLRKSTRLEKPTCRKAIAGSLL